MNNEFKKSKNGEYTVYTLESATGGGTSAGSVASVSMPMGGVRRRGDNLIAQEEKKEAPKPRNFVAKNAKMGGAGKMKDKAKTIPRKEKHKKPLAESYAEDLAKQVFNANPNIKDENAVLDAAWPIVVKDLGNKRAMSMFNYDEDFPSDLVSVYSWLQKDHQGVAEAGGLDNYRQRVNSQGFTDSPEERDADRSERKRRHQDALNRISDIGGGSSDEERAHQAQQRMARDEYKLDRLKRNDDDWENTFDMMRDRMNRYQWSSQRDVDPEQLAAISNIKYEPRKKTESSPAGIQQSWTNSSDASYTPGRPMPQPLSKKMSQRKPSGVQAKTDDELLAYYAQRKAEKEKQKQQGVSEDHEIQMASSELQSIAKNAVNLLSLVRKYSEQEGLEAWQQSKITKAADYLNSVLQSISGEQTNLEGAGIPFRGVGGAFNRGDDEHHHLDTPNNYAVAIDGKTWKVFADQRQAQNIARSLQSKGKNAKVHLTGASPTESVEEEWSQKYKSSINCSHPKGFSQKAHCAGKKKHDESIEMESVCPDCGMCQTHGDNMMEVKQRLDAKCWKGKHKEGTKIKGGIRVNNCVPNNESVAEDVYMMELSRKLAEKIPANAPVDVWVQDFQKADPNKYHQFKNKTPAKKAQMAVAASYAAKNPNKKK